MFLILFCLRIPVIYLVLVYDIYKIQKFDIFFDVIPFHSYSNHQWVKYWHIYLKFCMVVEDDLLLNIYYIFFLIPKQEKWDFIVHLTKTNLKFWGSKSHNFENKDINFVDPKIFHFHSFDKSWCDSVQWWMICDRSNNRPFLHGNCMAWRH